MNIAVIKGIVILALIICVVNTYYGYKNYKKVSKFKMKSTKELKMYKATRIGFSCQITSLIALIIYTFLIMRW